MSTDATELKDDHNLDDLLNEPAGGLIRIYRSGDRRSRIQQERSLRLELETGFGLTAQRSAGQRAGPWWASPFESTL